MRNELIGIRADLKDKKTFRMADQVAIGILLAGFASFAIAVVFGIFVALLGRR